MQNRYYTAGAALVAFIILLAVWPPIDAKSQSNTEDIITIQDSVSQAFREGDSLRHAIKVELDLSNHKNQADTL